jgi:hypothetical protein
MAIKVPIMKQFSKDYVTHKHESLPQEKRSEALTKFILSLSDQQLVTGLAILIASLSNRCRVSVYEFRVVVSLAWFSSTTHQSTLRVLQHYLFANKVVRNWRIVAMVCLMVILIFGLIAETGSAPQTTALQCGIGNISGGLESLGPSQEFGNQAGLLSMIIICIQLLFTYGGLVYDLFRKTKRPGRSIAEEIAKRIAMWRTSHRYEDVKHGFSAETKSIEIEAVWEDVKKEAYIHAHLQCFWTDTGSKREFLSHCFYSAPSERAYFLAVLQEPPCQWTGRSWGPGLEMMILCYQGSFLSKLPPMLFDLAFGISQVVSSRWKYAPELGEASNRMDFGQIVPLFLLSLPMLVAAEIYYGELDCIFGEVASTKRTLDARSESKEELHSSDLGSVTTLSSPNDPGAATGNRTRSVLASNVQDIAAASPTSTELFNPSARRQILKLVLYYFCFELLSLVLIGSTYNLQGFASFIVSLLYIIWNFIVFLSTFITFTRISKPSILHTRILSYRAKQLAENSTQPSSASSADTTTNGAPSNGTRSPNQSIELRSFNNQPQGQHALASSATPSPVLPADDGRLHVAPQRHDTEADLGLHPQSSRTALIPTAGAIFAEPESMGNGPGTEGTTGQSSNVETTRDGTRRRNTVEGSF